MNDRDERKIADILDEYMAQRRNGNAPPAGELKRRHPALASELDECLSCLDLIEVGFRAKGDEGDSASRGNELIGGMLGDFRILREVGRGGMGVVYEAEQVSLGRRVALKVLPFAAVFDDRHLQRFKNEAQAAAFLHHTNIVPVHAVGQERGVHYYAMQFIAGRSLSQVVDELRKGPVKPSQPLSAITKGSSTKSAEYCRAVAKIGIQAAEALAHAHERGVVHRDIKPANLMVDPLGHLWVTDFGLASFQQGQNNLTMTGDLLGTIRYMSPEQALAKRGVIDHRTDIYSLGVTLYELLTLQVAFPGDNPQEVMRRIALEDPIPARKLNPAIPMDLETIVIKATAKDPGERYGSAEELAEDLERFLAHEAIVAKRPSLLDLAGKWVRRNRVLAGSSVVVLLVVTIALAFSIQVVRREERQTAAALKRAGRALESSRKSVDVFIEAVGVHHLNDRGELQKEYKAQLDDALVAYEDYIAYNPTAHAYTARARILHALKRYPESLASYEEAAKESDDTMIVLERGHILLHVQRDDEAMQAFASVPSDWTAQFFRGNALMAMKKWERALDAYDLAAAIKESPQVHNNRGVCLMHLGRSEEAIVALQAALQTKFGWWGHRGAHHNMADAFVRMERYDEAVRACDRAIALDPDNAVFLALRGKALRRLGRLDEALRDLDHALAHFNAGSYETVATDAHVLRGSCLQLLGRHEDALDALDTALSTADKDQRVTSLSFKVFSFLRLQRPDEALAVANEAVRLDPNAFTARWSRAVCYTERLFSNPKDESALSPALEDLNRAITLKPDDYDSHLARVRAYHMVGQDAACAEAATKAIAAIGSHPKLGEFYSFRGFSQLGLGESEAGLRDLTRALASQPANPQALVNRVAAFIRLKRYGEALAAANRGLEQQSRLPRRFVDQLYRSRGDLLVSHGRLEEALETYRAVFERGAERRSALANLVEILSDGMIVGSVAGFVRLDPEHRDPPRAVELARKLIEISSNAEERVDARERLVVALYCNNELEACVKLYDRLERDDVFGAEALMVAMARHRLKMKGARELYDKAVAWTLNKEPGNEFYAHYRAEAKRVIESPSPPGRRK